MKLWVVSIMLSVFVGVYSYIHVTAAKVEPTINVIIDKMQKQDVEITDWSLYAKQGLLGISNTGKYDAYITDLKHTFPTAMWTKTEGIENIKAVGTYTYEDIDVRIVCNYIKKEKSSQISLQFTGHKWNGKLYNKQQKWINIEAVKILKNKPVFFTCVKGLINVNLNGTLQKYVENVLTDFSAKEIERMEEDAFLSVSAYTEQWKSEIPIQHSKMNMQIAFRKIENNRATVVIGTPIITMEY